MLWQRSAWKWMQFSVCVQVNIWTIPSFEPPSSILGRDRHALADFFVWNPMLKNLFEAFFFGILRIFSRIQPKSECNFLFLYQLIFKPYHLSSPLTPLWGVMNICPRGLFCPKFDAEKLVFEAFFSEYSVFLAVFSRKVNVFFHFCTI